MNAYDRVAVITSGAQGIGFAIAERLVASGAQVALWDLDAGMAEEAAKHLGGGTYYAAADVADSDAVHEVAAQINHELGQIN